MKIEKTTFRSETEMCASFIRAVPTTWTIYPETGDFDIILSRNEDGFQIGIEAKLSLNAKVILQVAESMNTYDLTSPAPDCRAVLVPRKEKYGELGTICKFLGITVIGVRNPCSETWSEPFTPSLPRLSNAYSEDSWFERAPSKRIKLPEYIPDVPAGCSSPIKLTRWKVGAIRLSIILEKRGYLRREDFKTFQVNMQTWIQNHWLKREITGELIKDNCFPDFRKQHPKNYAEIEDDYEQWAILIK